MTNYEYVHLYPAILQNTKAGKLNWFAIERLDLYEYQLSELLCEQYNMQDFKLDFSKSYGCKIEDNCTILLIKLSHTNSQLYEIKFLVMQQSFTLLRQVEYTNHFINVDLFLNGLDYYNFSPENLYFNIPTRKKCDLIAKASEYISNL